MTSLFYEDPKQKLKYGDTEFEWRSLLNTPCYGFSGPNACYSTTCTHNARKFSESELQLIKSKQSTKFYNKKKSSPLFERAADYNSYRSSLLTFESFGPKKNTYEGYEFNSDAFFNTAYYGNHVYDNSPLRKTDEFNQMYESPSYYSRPVTCSTPFEESNHSTESSAESSDERISVNSSHETVVSTKKYAFNPLSEPFQPMRKSDSNTSSSTTSVTTDSVESSPIIASTTVELESSWRNALSNETKVGNFVCMLCNKKYSNLDDLTTHFQNKVHLPHVCEYCGVSFEHSYLLNRHVKSHPGVRKSFKCRGCNKKFRSLNQLAKHFEDCRFNLYMFT
ncbi:protein snail homolog Sna-like [Contarinia nasturtii]|uniref:protein snail homolog Sna-like n=1 Tax=Contarinia nasturtii TaxID=265458 RepID=UPI0012D3DC63|nr:protein snail homolog Sna-like [Contarinia nasturtii]